MAAEAVGARTPATEVATPPTAPTTEVMAPAMGLAMGDSGLARVGTAVALPVGFGARTELTTPPTVPPTDVTAPTTELKMGGRGLTGTVGSGATAARGVRVSGPAEESEVEGNQGRPTRTHGLALLHNRGSDCQSGESEDLPLHLELWGDEPSDARLARVSVCCRELACRGGEREEELSTQHVSGVSPRHLIARLPHFPLAMSSSAAVVTVLVASTWRGTDAISRPLRCQCQFYREY